MPWEGWITAGFALQPVAALLCAVPERGDGNNPQVAAGRHQRQAMRDGRAWPLPTESSSALPASARLWHQHPVLLTREDPQSIHQGWDHSNQAQPWLGGARKPASGTPSAHLNSDGRVTVDSESRRKCCWEMSPVLVSTVMTGKPICRIQRSMILRTGKGSWMAD